MAPEPEAKRRAPIRTAANRGVYGVLAARRRPPRCLADVPLEEEAKPPKASPVVEQMRRKSPRKCKLEEFAILGIRKFDKFGVVGISCLTFSGKFRYNTGRIELLQSVSPNSPGLRFFLLCRSGRRHRSSGRSAPSGLPLRHDPLGPVPALVPDHPGHRPAAAGAGRGARRAESVSFLRQRKK